jgi:hypothetical protein
MRIKEIYSPAEAIEAIREALEEDQTREERLCLIEAVVERTPKAEAPITLSGVKAGILEIVNRRNTAALSVSGEGDARGVHRNLIKGHLERGGDEIPTASFDKALLELEREGKLHDTGEGRYRLGRRPETTTD